MPRQRYKRSPGNRLPRTYATGVESLEQRRVLSTTAYYRFEDGFRSMPADASQPILDSSGNGLSGLAVGGPTYQVSFSEGTPIPATGETSLLSLQFDGATQRIEVPDRQPLQLTASLTIEAYVILRENNLQEERGTDRYIVFRGDDSSRLGSYSLAIKQSPDGDYWVSFRISNASRATDVVEAEFTHRRYKLTHVAATLDDSTGAMCIYIEGELAATMTTNVRPAGALSGPNPGVGIGGLQSPSAPTTGFNGLLDEVRISDVALTPASFLITAPAPASDFDYVPNATGITITRYKGLRTDVVVPARIAGQPVTQLGNIAFAGRNDITRIVLPQGVTRIGAGAFQGCAALTSVNIPAGVTEIGVNAFMQCASLTTLSIPASVTSINVQWTFLGCSKLTAIDVARDNLTYASVDGILYTKDLSWLMWCPTAKSGGVVLPSVTKTIGSYSFSECTQVTSVTMPATLVRIESGAFHNCTSLSSYYFKGDASAITSDRLYGSTIGATAFYVRGTKGWTSTFLGMQTATTALAPTAIVATPGNGTVSLSWKAPTDVGGSAVTGYVIQSSTDGSKTWSSDVATGSTTTSFTTAASNGVVVIYRIAAINGAGVGEQSAASARVMPTDTPDFTYEPNETGIGITGCRSGDAIVTVPSFIDGKPVTALTGSAFMWCGAIEQINIPAGVTSINVHWAFWECNSLKAINVAHDNPRFTSVDGILYYKDLSWLAWCPAAKVGDVILPDATKTVGYFSFFKCKSITSITFPADLVRIEADFGGCDSLKAYYFKGDASTIASGPITTGMVSNPLYGSKVGATAYYVRGTKGWTSTFLGMPTATTSLEPTPLNTTSGNTTVRLNWTAPVDDGRSPITGYVVQTSTDGGKTWSQDVATGSTTTTALKTGLVNGKAYLFRVAAVNSAGVGDYTLAVAPAVPATVPAAPTSVTATPGDASVTVRWKRPIQNGGAAVTDYAVQYSGDRGLTWKSFNHTASPATVALVTGLSNGTAYVFRVAAINRAGTGGFSDVSPETVPATVPTAPKLLLGAPGNASVSLAWAEPSWDGGAAVTDYIVQVSANNGTTWSTFARSSSTMTSAVVTELTNGIAYVFRVAAINRAGTGMFSAMSAEIVPATMADAPSRILGTAGNASVSIAWTAPAWNGGASVTDYAVQYSGDQGLTWKSFVHTASSATVALVTGLSNGTAYVFRVAAINRAGTGRFGVVSDAFIPATNPDAPNGLIGTSRNTQSALSWKAPGDNGGAAITDYAIQYSDNRGITWRAFPHSPSPATAAIVSGLTNGSSYVFRVAAINRAGAGRWSTVSAPVTPAVTVPDAPTLAAVLPGNGVVTVNWLPPVENGGSAITHYIVSFSRDGGSTWTTFKHARSTLTTLRITGLANGTGYVFRVAAVNGIGISQPGQVSPIVTPATVPGRPTKLTVSKNAGDYALVWLAPVSNGGTPITDYRIEYSSNGGRTWKVHVDPRSTVTSMMVKGLPAGRYSFRVSAVNAMGVGASVRA